MKHHIKFENLEEELSDLSNVLRNSLQNEVLSIKKIDKNCEKFQRAVEEFYDLDLAEYVIYSKYMGKEYHNLETFIFVDSTGKDVCNLSGREIELYNMIKECDNLIESKDY